jgi:Rod binding domain-containing protein
MQTEVIHGAGTSAEAGSLSSPRLAQAAHEFEGQLMKELLRPMTADDALGGEENDDAGGGSNGALGEFATEAMGKALSESGGFGIANQIMRELSRASNHMKCEK